MHISWVLDFLMLLDLPARGPHPWPGQIVERAQRWYRLILKLPPSPARAPEIRYFLLPMLLLRLLLLLP